MKTDIWIKFENGWPDPAMACFLLTARSLFEDVVTEFQPLTACVRDHPNQYVDLELEFAPQPGLLFQVIAELQGDELCLGIGDAFWCEWFPCSTPSVVNEFRTALQGILSGQLRVKEAYRGGRIINAKLQREERGRWITIAKWACVHLPSPTPATYRILQNSARC